MNEQDNNTESTSTPNPESSVETIVSEVTETTVEKTDEITEPVVVSTIEDVKEDITLESEEKTVAVAESTEDNQTPAAAATYVTTAAALPSRFKQWVLGRKYTIAAVVLVLVAGVGLTYVMEEQGRIQTGIFDKASKMLTANTPVAVVNGEKITKAELATSVSQISAGAEAQGMDITNPELQAQIRTQAVDMLVNTELLMQEAELRGVSVSDEDVDKRIETLKTDVGGEEVLMERMKEFGIDTKTLRRDVRNELTIQALLEAVFAEKTVEITDEEVKAFYEQAGGEKAGFPALEEVAEQIKAQISSTREQEQVTTLIEELRGKATIEVK